MINENIKFKTHELTNEELGKFIRDYRNDKGLTQEILAELAEKSLRTIQRIEKGEPSDLDTRRSIAKAFEFDDIDFFNKPMLIPDLDSLRQEQERLEKETITKSLEKISSGRDLRESIEISQAFVFHQLIDMEGDAEQIFAEMQDYARDYCDIYSVYSATEKLEVNKYFQQVIDSLLKINMTIGIFIRKLVRPEYRAHL